MKNIKHIIIFIATVLLSCTATARTVEIKMSTCPKPYVENIRKMTASLGATDELILNFDKVGKYEFDGSLKFKCNTVIKGLGPNSTKVIVKEGFAAGKSKMLDDTFFAVHGLSNQKVKAEVRDVHFELASHKGTLWETSPKHIVKIWNGDGILVDNVTFWSTDAVITHLDLRECSNAVVQNCSFENYNNCEEGGCLWSRGRQDNIVVKNNVFSKYGKDEVLAFWGGNVHKSNESSWMRNIKVENNEFYYGNKIKSKKEFLLSVFICFYHFTEKNTQEKCDIKNLSFTDNNIVIDAPVYRNVSFNFDKLATIDGIEISNNTITNTSRASQSSNYMNDIVISAIGNINRPVVIANNIVRSLGEVLCDGKNSGYIFLSIADADAILQNNVINSDYPIALLLCNSGKMDIRLEDNNVSQLYKLGILKSRQGVEKARITASGNTFSGDTRIYCDNVEDLTLNFTNNTYNSNDYHFFLQDAARTTSIVFNGNNINALTRKGIMFANYSQKTYNFTKLEVTNNTFYGLSRNAVEDSFKSVRNKTIKNNIYR